MRTRSLLLLVIILLAIPLIPFLLFHDVLDEQTARWMGRLQENRLAMAGGVIALLASDILLPVPSSFVCTAAGRVLGFVVGTLVCFTGLTIGAMIGFGLAAVCGQPLVRRLCDVATLDRAEGWLDRYGKWAVIVSRPLPLVAEAVILLLGVRPRVGARLLPVLVLSNLVLAASWVAFGMLSAYGNWEWLAGTVSVIVPLLGLLLWQQFRGDRHFSR